MRGKHEVMQNNTLESLKQITGGSDEVILLEEFNYIE